MKRMSISNLNEVSGGFGFDEGMAKKNECLNTINNVRIIKRHINSALMDPTLTVEERADLETTLADCNNTLKTNFVELDKIHGKYGI